MIGRPSLISRRAGPNRASDYPNVNDPATDEYVQERGGGVMVIEPKYFGRAFLPQPENAED